MHPAAFDVSYCTGIVPQWMVDDAIQQGGRLPEVGAGEFQGSHPWSHHGEGWCADVASLNPSAGQVEILDDIIDHWDAKSHIVERDAMVGRLQVTGGIDCVGRWKCNKGEEGWAEWEPSGLEGENRLPRLVPYVLIPPLPCHRALMG